ncbi:nuclear transport factor 2 family protein [Paraburkholderia sp. BL21I4N1]|uniref:nuclear transport factor 2 family protein n=1 Tax=Paraburkholderia sp. BL21I4N1 TaxID=1938801 RepID=UPI000CFDF9E2|nr:nuclear transport factor 2 family protein [Paraburkholderia sp. BL21I4N1]PQV55026.1 ketosteroid isomerase-like protein [Paraburkholderia sp. BL21I4N1]
MSHPNIEVIERFYTAFQQRDGEAMAACYADDVVFSDPVFGELRGDEARDMWRMLVARAQNFSLTFDHVEADEHNGRAHWVARYLFSQTGREVVNRIDARFVFRDGRIVEHRDSFDVWLWSRQALGAKGTLLGWSPLVKRAIRAQAKKGLALYRGRQLQG